MSIVSEVTSVLTHAAAKAETVVEPILEKVLGKDVATKLTETTVAILGTEAGKIVHDTVAFLSTLQVQDKDGKISFLTGASARAAALRLLENDARLAALHLSESLFNLLIELAVQYVVKGTTIAAGAAVAAAV